MRVSIGLPVADWQACAAAARQAEEDGADAVTASELKHDPFTPAGLRRPGHPARRPGALGRDRVSAQPDGGGEPGVGCQSPLQGKVRRRAGQPGEGPQRAPVQHALDRSGGAAGRICRGIAGDLPLLGDRGEAELPRQVLQFLADDAGVLTGTQGLPMPPIAMAAVGPLMVKTAARVADSVRLHSFATREYLEQVVRPVLAQELAAAGKSFENFEITGGGFIATGPDTAAVKEAGREGALSGGVLWFDAGVSRGVRPAWGERSGRKADRDVEAGPMEANGGPGA